MLLVKRHYGSSTLQPMGLFPLSEPVSAATTENSLPSLGTVLPNHRPSVMTGQVLPKKIE
jgi:hypothetical protein